ncbi:MULTISPECIES: hypothetical protein [Sphingobacterium]|jgi:uncharacterized protein YbjQ (UPF0145 family)|nr:MULTISPECIES: hypothetical protein [Sphingobacterium]KKX47242.1 hypothetical protein L950_0227610 [Sphingobacterium sp. IITKGP-BTPF85]MCW2259677.1 uncharacterized protein YbjQ (UPF0145 family) [Sphingobacterium kitahiroshimense]
MIVTSTNTIEGREVLRYFDPISATDGIDKQTIEDYDQDLTKNLDRLW